MAPSQVQQIASGKTAKSDKERFGASQGRSLNLEDANQPSFRNAAQATGEGKQNVVLGAERPLGDAVVQRLVAESTKVKAVVLEEDVSTIPAPDTAERLVVDPMNAESIAQVCRGAGVVFDCYEPNYGSLQKAWPVFSSNIIYAAIEVGVPLVFVSHLRNRELENSRLEEEVLRANQSGLTKTVVGRVPQLIGKRVINPLWRLVYDSVLAGKKAHWVGNPDVRRSLLDVEDAARALIHLGGSPAAFGRAWSIANPETISGRRFAELAFRARGLEPNVGSWGRGIVLTGGPLSSDAFGVLKMPYDYYSAFVLDGKEFCGAFPSFQFTPLGESVSNGLAWYEEWRRTRD
jgi:hypothetical protein